MTISAETGNATWSRRTVEITTPMLVATSRAKPCRRVRGSEIAATASPTPIAMAEPKTVEVNLLGLVLGLDFRPPALKLPGIGNVPPRNVLHPERPMST